MQPEAYQHDYTAVEQRLKQLEAVAYYKRLVGLSALVLAVTIAACAFVLCAAYAWRLVTQPQQIEEVVERAERASVPDSAPNLPDLPNTVDAEPGVVTMNFALFRETEVEVEGRAYIVIAGHKYLTETDTTFANAWCYTEPSIDNVVIKIDLGTLKPGSVPIPSPVSFQTLAQTDLTQADLTRLFASCPWLSGNPNVPEAVPPQSIVPDI